MTDPYDRPLLEAEAATDPIEQFGRWFAEAEAADIDLPHAMTLATVSGDGTPSVRSVLLKEFDQGGFTFYTSYRSRKAQDLEANPRSAAALRWIPLHREVRIEGSVGRVDPETSDVYFATRPRESQLAAWASPQSAVIGSRAELEQQLAQAIERFGDGEVPRPDHWGGYRILPDRIEFWQGRAGRLHDRLRYQRRGRDWVVERLAP